MKRAMLVAVVLCSVWISVGSHAVADPVSYFRRDNGVAAGDSNPLPDRFDSKEQLIWRQSLLPGHSTPCVSGDSIFLTTFDEEKKQLATAAIDRATGKVRWQRVAPAKEIEPQHLVGSPASCSAACDGKRVYVSFGSYGVLCYDLDGKLLWSKPMGPFQDEFGTNSSPILVDDKVIMNQDHDVDCFLIAVDQKTGRTLWKTPREGFTRSYSTPIVWNANGVKQVIVAGSLELAAYDVEKGQKVWWVRGLSRIVDPTPVMANGLLYLATWTPGGDPSDRIAMEPFSEATEQYDKNGDGKIAKSELPEGPVLLRFFRIDLNQDGALDATEWAKHARVFDLAQNVALAVRPGGKGDVTDSHVEWIYRRGLPVVPSSVVYDGVLFMVKNSGIITSVDAKTGKLLKQARAAGRGNYYASLVAGDGKVYLASEGGVVTVLKAGRDWEILSHHDFGERIMATPVVADGRIYLRTDDALYCFEKR